MINDTHHFSRRLIRWYDQHRRDLPWRAAPGTETNPYHVLVSELMLQQTQVRTVVPYFNRFIETWPTVKHFAKADEQEVLRAWQGLGYYSRARNLLATARMIVAQHNAVVPSRIEDLLKLPGIGRYTAGAVTSIGYDKPAPILDGNVARVLCRLDKIASDPRHSKTQKLLWQRAEDILPERRVGDFNSALMELGATVCTPKSPKCLLCPVRQHCQAFAANLQDRIPIPRPTKSIPTLYRRAFCIRRGRDGDAAWLIEQRPSTGRWAGLWQFITTEAEDAEVTAQTVRSISGGVPSEPRKLGQIEHGLSHRRYRFEIYLCGIRRPPRAYRTARPRHWVRLDELHRYPLPRPHLHIAEMLRLLEQDRSL